MKYVEFDSGFLPVNGAEILKYVDAGTASAFLAFDVANLGSNPLTSLTLLSGEWAIIAEDISTTHFSWIGTSTITTGLSTGVYYEPIKRVLGSPNPGILPANSTSTISVNTLQSSLFWWRADSNAPTVIQVSGVFKGGWESEWSNFDVNLGSDGFAVVPCFSAGAAGIEIKNNGSSALTEFGIQLRTHSRLGTWRTAAGRVAGVGSNNFASTANAALTNAHVWMTRCSGAGAGLYPVGGSNPYTIPAGGSAFVDLNCTDAAQIRFASTPGSNVQIRGTLKG